MSSLLINCFDPLSIDRFCPFLNLAKTTRAFWNDSNNVKYRKLLCQPERKLVITSKEHAAWPSNSVSQPMLFLFSDLLASWTQMSLTQWPIKLMWIKSYSGSFSNLVVLEPGSTAPPSVTTECLRPG